MRLHGVDKLSELVEELGKEGLNTARKVQEKTKQVRELAEAIEKVANPEKKGTKPPAPPAPPNRTQQPIPAPPLPLSVQNVVVVGKGKEGSK
jgi:hypothetical protein